MVLILSCKRLKIVPSKRGGRPIVKGARVSIDDILERLTIDRKSEEVSKEFEIPLVAVHDGLRPVSKAM